MESLLTDNCSVTAEFLKGIFLCHSTARRLMLPCAQGIKVFITFISCWNHSTKRQVINVKIKYASMFVEQWQDVEHLWSLKKHFAGNCSNRMFDSVDSWLDSAELFMCPLSLAVKQKASAMFPVSGWTLLLKRTGVLSTDRTYPPT